MSAIPDLTNLQEWNSFCEKSMTVLDVLTLLNNRHRECMAKVIKERDGCVTELEETRAELAQYRAAVQALAAQDFGASGWDEQCNNAAILLRNLLQKHD